MIRVRIKEIAQEKGISMTKLSFRSETSYNTIKALYRNPYRTVINMPMLERIAHVLEVSPLDLLEYIPGEDVPPDKGKR